MDEVYSTIATGNWGCGAFKGDIALKAMIQWIAGSLNNKSLIYCAFNRPEANLLKKIVPILLSKNYTTNKLVKLIDKYLLNQTQPHKRVDSLIDKNH